MKISLISFTWLGTSVNPVHGLYLTREIGFDTIDIFVDPIEPDPAAATVDR